MNIWTDPNSQQDFRIANGKIVQSVGTTGLTSCFFAKDKEVEFSCMFFVFETLITPIIMGMSFLQETQTLSKNRHRLERLEFSSRAPVQSCFMNSPNQPLLCVLEGVPVLANADTGSNVNLISLAFAKYRGFSIIRLEEECGVQFANGEISRLCGELSLTVVVGALQGMKFDLEFFVTENLSIPVVLGDEMLYDSGVFEMYEDAFSLEDDGCPVPETNAIAWFTIIERIFRRPSRRTRTNIIKVCSYEHLHRSP